MSHRAPMFLLAIAAFFSCRPHAAMAQTTDEWRDSLASLTRLIDKMPASVELRLKKAAVNIQLEQWDYAIDEYGRVLQIDSASLPALFYRAYANNHKHRYILALNDYDTFLGLVPRHFEAQYGRAMVLRNMGRRAEAIDELNRLVEMFPDSAVAYAARAGYETELNELALADYDWSQALRLDSDNVEYVVSRAEVLLAMKRKKEARRLLREAMTRGIPSVSLVPWLKRCE